MRVKRPLSRELAWIITKAFDAQVAANSVYAQNAFSTKNYNALLELEEAYRLTSRTPAQLVAIHLDLKAQMPHKSDAQWKSTELRATILGSAFSHCRGDHMAFVRTALPPTDAGSLTRLAHHCKETHGVPMASLLAPNFYVANNLVLPPSDLADQLDTRWMVEYKRWNARWPIPVETPMLLVVTSPDKAALSDGMVSVPPGIDDPVG